VGSVGRGIWEGIRKEEGKGMERGKGRVL